jgi:hypothetical protein
VRDDRPAAVIGLLEQEVDQAHVRAPEPGHDRRLAIERAGREVGAGDTLEVLAVGEDEMLMAGEDDVDALDRCKLERGILGAGRLIGGDAGVAEGDDEVGAFRLHLRHVFLRRLDDVERVDLAHEVRGVPGHDLRRQKADEAELDSVLGTCAILEHLGDDAVGGEVGRTVGLDEIGRHHGEFRAGERLVEELEAVVELVVAERAHFVAQRVHRRDHWVRLVVEALLVGDVIAHRIALDDVAIVDEDGIAGLGADLLDDCRGAGEAQGVVRRIGIIVVREDGDMDVGGFHDSEVRLARRRKNGERMEDDGGSRCGGAGEERAARNVDVHDDSP